MEPSESKKFVYEFGKFVLDPEGKTLYSDGQPIRLPAKEFETLLLLIENNGRALSKEEMMAAIWQDSFVEEGNLAKQVSRLRKIFNTDGEKFIETLPKHGYRFSADLRLRARSEDQPAILERRTVKTLTLEVDREDSTAITLPGPARGDSWARILAAACIVVLLGAFSAWFGYRKLFGSDPKINSIAVLPLRPLSPDDSNQILGWGLTDALITKLGSLPQIVVRPTSSVASFADSPQDSLEIGKRLNVDAVLEGTIQRSEGRLRINARLIRTATGEQIWAEKFDGEFTNVFEIQDQISEQAAQALRPTLSGEERGLLTKRHTANAQAFDAYVKGRYFWNKRTEDGFRKAIGYFDQAIEKDPSYATAYAGLADCYVLLGIWGILPPNEAMPKAKDASMKALAKDESLADAHVSLAFVKWVYDWDLAGADREFNRALELNPNHAIGHQWYSYYLAAAYRPDEAVSHIKRAQELEGPLSLSINTDVGEIYCWTGQYDKAIEQLNEVMQIEPNFAIARYVLAMTYIQKGLIEDAVVELEAARRLDNTPRMMSALGYAYGLSGRHAEARKIIDELKALSGQRYVSSFAIATVYAGLGEEDEALRWLEKAYDERSDVMTILHIYPWLNSLRSKPGFVKLQQRVGLSRIKG